MNEFIIVVGDKMVLVEKDRSISFTANFGFCTKFKVKDRAVRIANKIKDSKVVPSFGGFVYSSKYSVTPKQSPVNKSQPYRSI
jgi:hypothetical protein